MFQEVKSSFDFFSQHWLVQAFVLMFPSFLTFTLYDWIRYEKLIQLKMLPFVRGSAFLFFNKVFSCPFPYLISDFILSQIFIDFTVLYQCRSPQWYLTTSKYSSNHTQFSHQNKTGCVWQNMCVCVPLPSLPCNPMQCKFVCVSACALCRVHVCVRPTPQCNLTIQWFRENLPLSNKLSIFSVFLSLCPALRRLSVNNK